MAEPTSAYSFEDLIIRVAEEAGIAYYGTGGDEEAMVPVDTHDLDLCRRVVNDGIKMFINDSPPKGWRWMRRTVAITLTATSITGTADSGSSTTLVDATLETTYDTDDDLNGYWIYITGGTGDGNYAKVTDYTASGGTVTVADWLDESGNPVGVDPDSTSTYSITPVETVNGDIHRYPLPENFGGEVDGKIHYASSTNHASIINWIDESFIRQRRAVTVTTGYPLYAAIRRLEPKATGLGPKRRWEIIFDPEPVAADTVEFPYTVFHDKLQLVAGSASAGDTTSLTDSSIANYYPDDYFNGWRIKIISGTGKYSTALVTDYTGTTGAFTVADWLWRDGSTADGTDPSSDSIYVVAPVNNLHPAGFMFDDYIEAACLARAEERIEDIQAGFMAKYKQDSLVKAYATDTRSAPRTLGPQLPGNRHGYRFERTFKDIEYS